MTNRELLEFAAKAAGLENEPCLNGWEERYPLGWNPLTDDGDAFRLAIKLNIRFVLFPETIVKSRGVAWVYNGANCSLWEPEGIDPFAATRKAIVRAAAEIGKGNV